MKQFSNHQLDIIQGLCAERIWLLRGRIELIQKNAPTEELESGDTIIPYLEQTIVDLDTIGFKASVLITDEGRRE